MEIIKKLTKLIGALFGTLPHPIKHKASVWLWQYYRKMLNDTRVFHPWERREFIPFLEAVKGKNYDELTEVERAKYEDLANLFLERGIRVIKKGF